ncbi:MAG: S-methyl-5'-thioinosine phosphorylase [Pseudomonadota bacterium]
MSSVYAVIGGTGTGDRDTTAVLESVSVDTAFGEPSAPLKRVRIGASDAWFLPRHGEGHQIAPHRVNYAANLSALATVGVTHVIALNAVGIIGQRVPPGGLLLPDQIIDYTWGRVHSVRDGVSGPLEHIDFTQPYDETLRLGIAEAARAASVPLAMDGVYGATQGPRLETAAEVARLARDGVEVIGMTGMPEASIARELGLSYACLALIVNEAAGQGAGDIHAQLVAAMQAARHSADKVLTAFFDSKG